MRQYELLAEIFEDDAPNRRGVDLVHLPHMPSLEWSREFEEWAAEHGFPTTPERPDVWINLTEPHHPNHDALAAKAFSVGRIEFDAFRRLAR